MDNLTPLTPEEMRDWRNAKPKWATEGLMIREPQFVQSTFESKPPVRTKIPRRPAPREDDHVPDDSPPCCLYPFGNPGVPIPYPVTDLPATINSLGGTINPGGTLIFVDAPIYDGTALLGPFGFTDTGTPDKGPPSGWSSGAVWTDEGWFFYAVGFAGQLFNGGCLITLGNDFFGAVADFFTSTYLVNGIDVITAVGTAGYTCAWTGPKTGGGTWILRYNSTGPNIYKWTLNGVAKTDPQSSPVGVYGSNTVA